MVMIPKKHLLHADTVTGRIGRSAGFGAYVFGANRFGEYSEEYGVYQRHMTKRGLKRNRHITNWPTPNKSPAQQAWFDLFKAGMQAWKELDTETKAEYNSRVYPPGLYGCNRFLQEYIKAHR
jgi:hypothetical protein